MTRSLATTCACLFIFATAAVHAETINDLVAKGCPSPDKGWQAKDYQALSSLLKNATIPLPRLNSEAGKSLFQRMVNTNNLSFHSNRNLPLDSRMSDLLDLSDSARDILVAYGRAANTGENVEKETAGLIEFHLAIASVQIDLVDEFIPTVQKDEKYQTRMEGFAKMKKGITGMIAQAILSLSERNFYSDESRIKLARAIRKYFPHFDPLLPISTKLAFQTQIAALLQKEERASVQLALQSLMNSIKIGDTNAPQPKTNSPSSGRTF